LAQCPLLIIATTRSASYIDLSDTELSHNSLVLQPLSPQDSHALLDELLAGVDTVPVALRDLIVNTSSGNPLYLEELVKMLTENGTLLSHAEQWMTNQEPLGSLHVPVTLTALLQMRFDNLSSPQQLVLQVASVF